MTGPKEPGLKEPGLKQLGRRVCIFPDRIDDGGIDRYALNLAEILLQKGVAVDLFVTSEAGKLLPQRPKASRLFVGGGSTKKSVVPFYRYLRQEQPDLLISANLYIDIVSIIVRKLARVPTRHAVTLHTAFSREDYRGKPWLKNLYTQLCTFLYPFADDIVAVSHAVARDSQNYFNLKKPIMVIYNPVVTPALFEKSKAEPQHPFYASKKIPVLLAIGRLSAQKDFSTLLRGFAELRKTRAAKLLILGEGEERSLLESLAKDLNLGDDLSMPGFVDNPYPFIKNSNILVSSSAWEGLPTVLIEALALGTPVVATDCPGGSSEILEGGKYGQLVPMRDPKALAQAMTKTLDTPLEATLLQARGEMFSLEASVQGYLALLNHQ
jgi:glycosyltransferase involved in cell wall biosynthesis